VGASMKARKRGLQQECHSKPILEPDACTHRSFSRVTTQVSAKPPIEIGGWNRKCVEPHSTSGGCAIRFSEFLMQAVRFNE
jgi:hypothetical protein